MFSGTPTGVSGLLSMCNAKLSLLAQYYMAKLLNSCALLRSVRVATRLSFAGVQGLRRARYWVRFTACILYGMSYHVAAKKDIHIRLMCTLKQHQQFHLCMLTCA